MPPRHLVLLSSFVALSCAVPTRPSPPENASHAVAAAAPIPRFRRSPGGTFEIEPEQVADLSRAGARRVRLVDVREAEELTDEFGHIAGVEHVALSELLAVAEAWDVEQPVVLVCRTGRRSARGVAQLEALGIRQVASMTGGMLRWKDRGLPVSVDPDDVVWRRHADPAEVSVHLDVHGVSDAPEVTIDATEVHWVRTASLLSGGSESCVDGRDERAVIGTPGGDAGELIVALTTVESFGSGPVDGRSLETLVDDWIDTFGRFYLHSDEHALENLRLAVLSDARFTAHGIAPGDVDAMEALVRHPPPDLESALLEKLVEPANVGCGHLRSMLVDPDDFLVRDRLPSEVLRAVFRHMWRSPEDVEWVVLRGAHREQAVVIVSLDHEVHAYTKVPAVPPSLEGRQTFVAHPQVTAYLREENASFLLERSPSLAVRVPRADFVRRMRRIADVQLEATLSRLARGLPVYEARFGAPGAPPVIQVR